MITSNDFRNAIISGANNIFKHQNHVNELNIFPVPDGDTGTNMCLTIMGVVEKINSLSPEATISEVADAISYSALRSSRGNSGVILSLLLKGFSKHFSSSANSFVANDFVTSLEIGVDDAYKSVTKPTEGTMLTVARVASEYGRLAVQDGFDFIKVLESICDGARKALSETPILLPILKKAGVVDAGGKGLCLILEGMLSYLRDGVVVSKDINSLSASSDSKFELETKKFDDDIRFTYCTEFIVEKFVNCNFDPDVLRKNLQKIGDCVIVMHDNEVIKTHVHTNSPDKVLSYALSYGKLISVKIDNLEEQKKNMINSGNSDLNSSVLPEKDLGTLAIANGDGIVNLFKDLGCDEVLQGGQSLNPSASQIAAAVCRVPAKTVFVFPNNKNIFMAAEQAKQLVSDRSLVIVPSRFIPQGVASMIAFNENSSVDDNFSSMCDQISKVKSGLITYAERNSEFGGFKINKGDSISLIDGKLVHVAKNHFDSIRYMLTKIPDNDCLSVDIYYSSSMTKIPDFVNSEIRFSKEIDKNFIFGNHSPGEIILGFNWY